MFRYNLRLIYRSFKRFKGSFFLNLIGLSFGMACALLIYLWVNDELHVDKFHEQDSHLFQVMANAHLSENIITSGNTPGLLAEALKEEIPEVEETTRTSPIWVDNTLFNGKDHVRAAGLFADENYFNVFSYELIQGDKNQVLSDKNAVVISESLARKLFQTTENVIGKTLEWQNISRKRQVVVSGIFKDVPVSSSQL